MQINRKYEFNIIIKKCRLTENITFISYLIILLNCFLCCLIGFVCLTSWLIDLLGNQSSDQLINILIDCYAVVV